MFSDASDSGFGAYVENSEISEVVSLWTGEESMKSSTWSEIEAISMCLNTIGERIRGKQVIYRQQKCLQNFGGR